MQTSATYFAGVRDRVYKSIKFDQAYQGVYFGLRPAGSIWVDLYTRYDDTIDYSHARAAKRFLFEPYMQLDISRHFNLRIDHLMQRLTVDAGRLYIANATDLQFKYQFDVRTFVRAIIQFSDIRRDQDLYAATIQPVTKELFTQLLFSYRINPQTVLFLGYSDNHFGTRDFSLTQTDRTFFVKIGYAWVL